MEELDDGEGFPQDDWIRGAGRGVVVVQAGDVADGGEGLPLGLAVAGAGGQRVEVLLEGEGELLHQEPGAEGPGGVVFVGDVEVVGGHFG